MVVEPPWPLSIASTRRIATSAIVDILESVRGWMLMRRAGLSMHDRAWVLSQLGKAFAIDNAAHALKLMFGLDSLPNARARAYVAENDIEYDLDDTYAADDFYEDYDEDTCEKYEEAYAADAPCNEDDYDADEYDEAMAAFTDGR